ncbi:hypothetical protein FEK42_19250 [Escherichia sp. E2748]|nr:hypothetical protein FEK42_19250 [Escherichia sp. E2748]
MSRTRLLPRFRNLPVYCTFEKPPCRVVFSFTEPEITRRKKGSQEDPFYFVVNHLSFALSITLRVAPPNPALLN